MVASKSYPPSSSLESRPQLPNDDCPRACMYREKIELHQKIIITAASMNGPASQPSEMWPIRNCFVVLDIAWRWPIDLQKWDMLLAMFHTTCLSCTFDCIGPVSRPFDCFQMSRARRPLMDGRTLMRGAREKHADKRRLLLAGWLAIWIVVCL